MILTVDVIRTSGHDIPPGGIGRPEPYGRVIVWLSGARANGLTHKAEWRAMWEWPL